MRLVIALLVLGSAVCLSHCCGPAIAAEPVSAELVCHVQHAIRYRDSAWSDARCERIAQAFAATPAPRELLAICIWESDLRPLAIAHRPGAVDVGLCAVACRGGTDVYCASGPARGATIRRLLDPVVNVAVASRVLESKRARTPDYLRAYSGSTQPGHRYAEAIGAIVSALGGQLPTAKGRRLRKLLEQIAQPHP